MLYQSVAEALKRRISEGIYLPGRRLPGVRRVAAEFSVSQSTAVAALHALEDEGWIEGKRRAGFFVRQQRLAVAASTDGHCDEPAAPTLVTNQAVTLDLLKSCCDLPMGRLGLAAPHAEFLPVEQLRRAFRQRIRWRRDEPIGYTFPPGFEALRQQIARRLLSAGCTIAPSRIVVTAGAQEAIHLSLKAVTEPGDVVVVESPTYYGLLQSIETLGLRAVEIPCDPSSGMSAGALRLALETWPVKACVLVPNHGNPLGWTMPSDAKREVAALLDEYDVALIEDDIYGELSFSEPRPEAIYSYLSSAPGYLGGSASKTISAGLRLGWLIAPESKQTEIEYLQFTQHAGANTLAQYALADYLANGGFDRHLRGVRLKYRELTDRMAMHVEERFPAGCRVVWPTGGYLIWVVCPKELDALALYRAARHEGVSIAPGGLFSTTDRYRSCFRLNAAIPWGEELESALDRLAVLTTDQLDTPRNKCHCPRH